MIISVNRLEQSARDLFKHCFFGLLRVAHWDQVLLRGIRVRRLVSVVNLHRVSPHPNPFWSPMHPDVFEGLLKFFSKRAQVTTLRNRHLVPNERPAVIFSFDDGYADFLEYAMPLLQKYRVKANLNVICESICNRTAPWNIQLYDFLNAAPRKLIKEIVLPGFNSQLNGDDVDNKRRYGLALSRFLKLRSRKERLEHWNVIAPIVKKLGNNNTTRMISLRDLQSIAHDHEIGAHSFSHESMGCEDNSFFAEDLDRCVTFFCKDLKLPLSIYAFPNGSYRYEQIEILRGRGIKHILLVGERLASRSNPVCPRITVFGDTTEEACFRSLGVRAR